jgi:hypothetical protein
MYEQKNWRIRFVNETEETVFGAEPRPSRDGHLLHVHEYYGVTGMQKGTRSFVLANVLTWEAA